MVKAILFALLLASGAARAEPITYRQDGSGDYIRLTKEPCPYAEAVDAFAEQGLPALKADLVYNRLPIPACYALHGDPVPHVDIYAVGYEPLVLTPDQFEDESTAPKPRPKGQVDAGT